MDRYEIVFLTGLDGPCSIYDKEAEIPTFYNDLGYVNCIKPVCDKMNEQDKEIKQLKKENEELKSQISNDISRRNEIKEACKERFGDFL